MDEMKKVVDKWGSNEDALGENESGGGEQDRRGL